jgi:hypothetical protein
LAEYNSRDFAAEDIFYSSFSYLIEAAQILGSVYFVAEQIGESAERTVVQVDSSLTSWTLNLPKEKARLVKADGRVDELLFSAHMMINTYVYQMIILSLKAASFLMIALILLSPPFASVLISCKRCGSPTSTTVSACSKSD